MLQPKIIEAQDEHMSLVLDSLPLSMHRVIGELIPWADRSYLLASLREMSRRAIREHQVAVAVSPRDHWQAYGYVVHHGRRVLALYVKLPYRTDDNTIEIALLEHVKSLAPKNPDPRGGTPEGV